MTKLTITVSASLRAELDAYAEIHSRLHGHVEVVTLIPHMLTAFMARDRDFRALRGKAVKLKPD